MGAQLQVELNFISIKKINSLVIKTQKAPQRWAFCVLAEKEGFEPPDLLQSTVFKTAAIDRSAISPRAKLAFESVPPNKKIKKT